MSHYEIEQKFKVKRPAEIRGLLKKMKAKLLHKGYEKNELWDKQGMVRKEGGVLRLREAGDKATLTFKGPKLKSRYKKRLEYETSVEGESCRKLLQAVGFKVSARYEKYREEYRLGKSHVTLDLLKKHGWFVEIEAAPAQIEALSKKLKFSLKDREERSYLEMVYGHRSVWGNK